MRLWTLHPRYLDAKGLVAAWREALLAQKVLRGATRGYRHHPQLVRFQAQRDSRAAIAAFLRGIAQEADRRGYNFDRTKISCRKGCAKIPETSGQLRFEWRHLQKKLRSRAPAAARQCRGIAAPDAHPLFRIVPGKVRPWEKTSRQAPKPTRPPVTAMAAVHLASVGPPQSRLVFDVRPEYRTS